MHDYNGKSRNYGFVVFQSPAILTRVLKQEHTIDGKLVDTKRAAKSDQVDVIAKMFVGGLAEDVNIIKPGYRARFKAVF